MRFGIFALFAAALFIGHPALAADGKITVQESKSFGKYLADGNGMPLYLFTTDTKGKGDAAAASSCEDDCATAWPPFTVETAPEVENPADGALVSTFERKDGDKQVTYNGWPLYTFIKDKAGEEPNGQDKHGFGGEWYLLTADGEKVHE